MFKLTYYSSDCAGCTGGTYTGTQPTVGRTIAVDPDVIPLNSKVLIDGTIYIAEDIGGSIDGNVIDVFVGSELQALKEGIKHEEIFIKK